MVSRILSAAVIAGISVGFLIGVLNHIKLTPLIIQAERFETSADHGNQTHSHAEGVLEHDHAEESDGHHHGEAWQPEDGLERTQWTIITHIIAAVGFALILAAMMIIFETPLSVQSGAMWGIAAFLSVSLLPAAGLPPELPGMKAANLENRQIWWITTAIATAAGLAILYLSKTIVPKIFALIIIAIPHIIGAPHTQNYSAVPAELAAQFATLSLAHSALFWILLGAFTSLALKKLTQPKDENHTDIHRTETVK